MGREQLNKRKRQKILERDNFKCVNCGSTGDFNCLEVDHIIPVIEGGTNDYNNLQTLCYKCNMDKRFKKNQVKQYFFDLEPIERLKLIRERLEKYKDLTYAEFKVIFTQDELFKKLRIDLLYLNDLFFEVSCSKKNNRVNESRYKEQRDKLLKIIHDIKQLPLRELEDFLKNNGLNISYSGLSRVFNQIDANNEQKSQF